MSINTSMANPVISEMVDFAISPRGLDEYVAMSDGNPNSTPTVIIVTKGGNVVAGVVGRWNGEEYYLKKPIVLTPGPNRFSGMHPDGSVFNFSLYDVLKAYAITKKTPSEPSV